MTKNTLYPYKKSFIHPIFIQKGNECAKFQPIKQAVDNFFKFSTGNIVLDSMEMSNFTA